MLQRLVNIIPLSLSGEAHQDSEPSLAVNPANTNQVVATALTPDPLQGPSAPIFVSSDRGETGALRTVVPGNFPLSGTQDISVGFAADSGALYVGILSKEKHMQILRTADFLSTATMSVLVDRLGFDQPWVVADTFPAPPGPAADRVYVGNNDLGEQPETATVDLSLAAGAAAPSAGFAPHRIVSWTPPLRRMGLPIRIAIHPGGTIYAVHQRWINKVNENVTFEVVVTRDDAWAAGANPFSASLRTQLMAASADWLATGLTAVWNSRMGQDWLGADSAVAVDPTNADVVWVAWGDQPAGFLVTLDYPRTALHRWGTDLVRRPAHRPKGQEPMSCRQCCRSLLAFLCHTLIGVGAAQSWETAFEVTANGRTTPVMPTVLHSALASSPTFRFQPYLGDYARLLTVDNAFYGIFSGSNHPDLANFPEGVSYQRNVNWEAQQLLDLDGMYYGARLDRPVLLRVD